MRRARDVARGNVDRERRQIDREAEASRSVEHLLSPVRVRAPLENDDHGCGSSFASPASLSSCHVWTLVRFTVDAFMRRTVAPSPISIAPRGITWRLFVRLSPPNGHKFRPFDAGEEVRGVPAHGSGPNKRPETMGISHTLDGRRSGARGSLSFYVLDDDRCVLSKRSIVRALSGGPGSGNLERYVGNLASRVGDTALRQVFEFELPAGGGAVREAVPRRSGRRRLPARWGSRSAAWRRRARG